MAIAVLVAALVAGAVVGAVVVLARPGTPGASTAVGAPVGTTAPAPTDDRAPMLTAVRDYYATVTGNSGAGWARLGPRLQDSAGGFTAYQGFWSTIASARVDDAETVDADTVRATVLFTPRSGAPVEEVHDLDMVRGGDGAWLIDSDRLRSD